MTRGTCRRLALAFATLVASTSVARAEPKPLWEIGLGAGAIAFPDYRGSDEFETYPIPMPYIIYRGKFLKSDRDGVRGALFDRDLFDLSMSVNGSIPVDSDDNEARHGMPDLKPTLELGPSLEVHLWKSDDREIEFDLVVPVRVPITLESSPRAIGWTVSPRLNLDIENIGASGWDFGVGAGPVFATETHHDYFYSVEPRYATADRPVYEAEAGYSGMHVLAALSKRFQKHWIGAYIRLDSVHGAVFEDSPLIRQSYAVSGGFGFARILGTSKRTVETDD